MVLAKKTGTKISAPTHRLLPLLRMLMLMLMVVDRDAGGGGDDAAPRARKKEEREKGTRLPTPHEPQSYQTRETGRHETAQTPRGQPRLTVYKY